MKKEPTALEAAFFKAAKKNTELNKTLAIAKASLKKTEQWKKEDKQKAKK